MILCPIHILYIVNFSRTWQKNRDSLVGWIGRTYKLNVKSNGWTYSYGYDKGLSPCHYSMAITPLLFHHKVHIDFVMHVELSLWDYITCHDRYLIDEILANNLMNK